MNKPFTLEEYKKNPSRLVWSHGKLPKIDESVLIFSDRHLSVRAGTVTWTYRIEDVPASFALSTEYEVRKARPIRFKSGYVDLIREGDCGWLSPDCNEWQWAGPEFEYKVEV